MPKHNGPSQERKPHRPAAVVFGDKLGKTYETYLNLASKVKGLSKHRAIRSEDGRVLADKLNAFIAAMQRDLGSYVVTEETAMAEPETPALDEFISQ